MRVFLIFVGVVAIISGAVSCQTWRFHECKKVGHGTAYCVYSLGNK